MPRPCGGMMARPESPERFCHARVEFRPFWLALAFEGDPGYTALPLLTEPPKVENKHQKRPSRSNMKGPTNFWRWRLYCGFDF
jgi:hypothetical protein